MKIVLFFLCLIVCGCNDHHTLSQIVFKEHNQIKVSINGHIKKPGTYLLEKESSTKDLIKLAGGYLENAQKLVDEKLIDNKKIFVNSNKIKEKININQASDKELEQVKGIGPSLAKKIIDHRLQIGKFESLEQLLDIKGIKEKKFKMIYEYLTL